MASLSAEVPSRRSSLLRELLHPPDSVLIDAGAEGEWTVARLRILMGTVFIVVCVLQLWGLGYSARILAGTFVSAVGIGCGAGIYLFLVHGRRRWLGYASSLLDVTLVSTALFCYAVVDTPAVAVQSPATFEVYFLAIAATSLRYDRRICLGAGGLALAQYTGIVLYAASAGAVDWTEQGTRLVLLAAAALLSWEVVRRAQQLRRLSTVDRLTGLLNRAHFDERAAVEIGRAERYGSVVAVAIIDLDFFKRINDTFGHAAGDDVLRIFAATLRRSVRASDIVARYGGEEFVALFPETTAREAAARMEALRIAFGSTPLAVRDAQRPLRLTFTAGVASFPDDGVTAESIVRAADLRLLAGKHQGRDRVVGPPARAHVPELHAE